MWRLQTSRHGYVGEVAVSWRPWLGKRALLIVPLLGVMYGVGWAVQGQVPFFASSTCPEPSASASTSPSSTTPLDDDRLSLSFGFQPDPIQPDAAVLWNFAVTNVSEEPVTMTFGSGQDGDVVLSQNGQERYRWSEGRSFTQAVRTIDLAPGEAYRFTLEDTLTIEPGSYELLATVSSAPAPATAERSATVGEPSPPGASEAPSPSGSAPPDPAASPSPTTSPSPTDAPTSSPSETASPIPLIPPAPRIGSGRRGRSSRRGRGRLWAIALAFALVAIPLGEVGAQEGGSGGKNVVLVINETDGRVAARAGLVQGRASGPTAVPENLASATASCTDCRTVAVALQAVLIISDPDVASPKNAAVAVNAGCTRCQTFAYAWQYVVTTGGPVRITGEGERSIADLRAEASSLAASGLPFPELVDELDEVAAKFRAVLDTEVERVGGKGVSERALDVEDDRC
jgi:hypothetical protein